jgi:hypothetical protein
LRGESLLSGSDVESRTRVEELSHRTHVELLEQLPEHMSSGFRKTSVTRTTALSSE